MPADSLSSCRPRLAITLGDPAGIGPEVILKALSDPALQQTCDITLVGSRACLMATWDRLQRSRGSAQTDSRGLSWQQLPLLDLQSDCEDAVGCPSAATGAASFAYLEEAITRTLAGEFDAIVTGPIAKSAWQAAGHLYPGQTELLAQRSKVARFGMLFVATSPYTGWTLRTLLATTHIPLARVPATLTPDLLSTKLELLLNSLNQDFGLQTPRIAIAGLNPHSGEQGQLGGEEVDWLIPWLRRQQQQYPHVQLVGPVPPDTLWVKPGQAWYGLNPAGQRSTAPLSAHDAYLALYHDQGLIPTKLLAFDRAVNTTLGLPFIRTSPDHGTAFDIAGQGIADATSMQAAIHLAIQLSSRRRQAADRR